MSTPAITSQDADLAAVPLRRALAEQLDGDGWLEDPAWRHAVETVPRHHFVPGFYLQAAHRSGDGLPVWEPLTARTDRDRWLAAAYTDQTLITQFDGDEPDWNRPEPRIGGAPTSSSTLPSLVVRMWSDADTLRSPMGCTGTGPTAPITGSSPHARCALSRMPGSRKPGPAGRSSLH